MHIFALVGRKLSIIAITANEPPIDSLSDRQIRFDIKCKARKGEQINVEMRLLAGQKQTWYNKRDHKA
jgi:hypothetical protein